MIRKNGWCSCVGGDAGEFSGCADRWQQEGQEGAPEVSGRVWVQYLSICWLHWCTSASTTSSQTSSSMNMSARAHCMQRPGRPRVRLLLGPRCSRIRGFSEWRGPPSPFTAMPVTHTSNYSTELRTYGYRVPLQQKLLNCTLVRLMIRERSSRRPTWTTRSRRCSRSGCTSRWWYTSRLASRAQCSAVFSHPMSPVRQRFCVCDLCLVWLVLVLLSYASAYF